MVTFYRRLPKFDYATPKSVDEALNLLCENHNGSCKVYAGGTDFFPKLKSRLIPTPKIVVDLKGIPDLEYIDYDEKTGLKIGALTTISAVANSSLIKEKFPVLSQAANSIGSIQVRNRGTIAGNICNAVPSADSAPALLALEATLLCVSNKEERVIGIDDFFAGPNETLLQSNELLKEIQISPLPENSNSVYMKLSPRSQMDLAVVGVAAVVAVGKEIFTDIRIGLGAVAPTPIRAREAEHMLKGEKTGDEAIMRAAKIAAEESKPIDDHRASAQYRRMMVEVLVRRAINKTLAD